MKIYEYGRGNPERILLIHPSLVTWDYFENVIPLLEQHYLKYMKKYVPDTVFKSFAGMDHGDMALFYPERMAQELSKL